MKAVDNANEYESILTAINNLSEEDAKALLRISYGYLNTAVTGNGGDKMKTEIVDKLSEVYDRVPVLIELREKGILNKND